METKKAVQQLSSGKAPGADAIPAEVYKAGGLPMAEKLTELFHCMWRKEAIPQEFKDASIIHLYKRKGNPQVCDNHRGISLLSIAGKIIFWSYRCSFFTFTSPTGPMAVPLVLFDHLLVQWLFLLYSCFSYNSLTSSIGTMVVFLWSYIIYWSNGCSSCTLTSFTGTMEPFSYCTLPSTTGPMVSCTLSSSSGLMSVPLVLYHYRLVAMVVPLVLYHHLLVQWLFLLYTATMY